MKHGTKYRLKQDRLDWPAGTIVYRLALCDYGVKNDDTSFTGIEHVSVTQDPEGGYPFITTPVDNLEEVVEVPKSEDSGEAILPPGPYRFEAGETAYTYRIFAAADVNPMVEMVYIGGAEDFAAVAKALTRHFAQSTTLIATLNTLREDCRMALSGEWDRSDSGFEAMMQVIDTVIHESTCKEAA